MTAAGVEKFANDLVAAYSSAFRKWKFDTKYMQLLLAAAALLAIGVAGYMGQNWYSARQAAAAQKAYAQCVRLLNDVEASGAREGWTQLERLAKSEYAAHAGLSMASYFKVIESKALAQLDDQAGAIAAAREAETLVRKGTPFVGQIRLHSLLMQMDSSDEAVSARALEELKNFAFDIKAPGRDGALYALGRYHWSRGEVDQAAELWRELTAAYQSEDGFSSAWAQAAARLLEFVP